MLSGRPAVARINCCASPIASPPASHLEHISKPWCRSVAEMARETRACFQFIQSCDQFPVGGSHRRQRPRGTRHGTFYQIYSFAYGFRRIRSANDDPVRILVVEELWYGRTNRTLLCDHSLLLLVQAISRDHHRVVKGWDSFQTPSSGYRKFELRKHRGKKSGVPQSRVPFPRFPPPGLLVVSHAAIENVAN